jgi:hypothetical protein
MPVIDSHFRLHSPFTALANFSVKFKHFYPAAGIAAAQAINSGVDLIVTSYANAGDETHLSTVLEWRASPFLWPAGNGNPISGKRKCGRVIKWGVSIR